MVTKAIEVGWYRIGQIHINESDLWIGTELSVSGILELCSW